MTTPTPGVTFNHVTVENALRVVRPVAGANVHVALYRLIRFVALEDMLGPGAASTVYLAGKKLAHDLGIRKIDAFVELCELLNISRVEMPVQNDDLVHVDVHECAACAGMETVGRMLCHFEGGLIAGVFEGIYQWRTRATEVSCIGGRGDQTCGFDLTFR